MLDDDRLGAITAKLTEEKMMALLRDIVNAADILTDYYDKYPRNKAAIDDFFAIFDPFLKKVFVGHIQYFYCREISEIKLFLFIHSEAFPTLEFHLDKLASVAKNYYAHTKPVEYFLDSTILVNLVSTDTKTEEDWFFLGSDSDSDLDLLTPTPAQLSEKIAAECLVPVVTYMPSQATTKNVQNQIRTTTTPRLSESPTMGHLKPGF